VRLGLIKLVRCLCTAIAIGLGVRASPWKHEWAAISSVSSAPPCSHAMEARMGRHQFCVIGASVLTCELRAKILFLHLSTHVRPGWARGRREVRQPIPPSA
jgi:hypothetical protein